MIDASAISSTIRRARRRCAALRARLRRGQAAIALVALLALSLGEPLLCIAHCQIWLPLAFQSYFGAQHQHHHHAAADAAGTHTAAALAAAPAQPEPCAMADGGAGAPFHVPPSPVHDMVATLIVLIVVVRLLFAHQVSPPGDPPAPLLPPLLRPPICCAA